MEIDEVTLGQIVIFAILMENNEGIIGKAPSYIREKFNYCMLKTKPEYLEAILDTPNRAKLQLWRDIWR